ncbi:MAG: hypothetical protein ACI959_001865, partial [Limisphaerales bacterium]
MNPNQFPFDVKSNRKSVVGFGLLGIIWVLVCSGVPFFWDAITLGSQTAAHFTESGLGALILPVNLDAGHPPLFGWYLAAVSGNNLFFNHLAMWPFLLLIWTQYYQYCNRFLKGSPLMIAMLLLFIEPTLLAQSIHVAPDLMLLAFFLLALNAILDRKTSLLVLALCLLCLSGLRGCIGSAALWFLALYLNKLEDKWLFSRFTLLPWVISTLLVISWFAYHYSQTGWLLANPDS